jgi:hypothetical protein
LARSRSSYRNRRSAERTAEFCLGLVDDELPGFGCVLRDFEGKWWEWRMYLLIAIEMSLSGLQPDEPCRHPRQRWRRLAL